MKTIKIAGKVVLAGLVSVVILSVLLCFYSLTPIHHENPRGDTDYVWEANSVWVKLTEGIAWGRYDADGFNNPEVIENPDIIIVGSSHMEAANVFYRQTVAAQLSQKLHDRYSVYNLGISGHHLFKVCQYLPVNLSVYDTPPKIAVIETSSVKVDEDNVQQVLDFNVERTPSHNSGLIALLQRIPFFRNVYHQMESGLLNIFMPEKNAKAQSDADSEDQGLPAESAVDETAYDKLFDYLQGIEKEYGTQIIIFYHPEESLNKDGDIVFHSSEYLTAFSKYAEKHGIDFIDMTEPFINMYYKDHLVAHGFVTGELGSGHLNANGHAAAAEEIYQAILKLEEDGTL